MSDLCIEVSHTSFSDEKKETKGLDYIVDINLENDLRQPIGDRN